MHVALNLCNDAEGEEENIVGLEVTVDDVVLVQEGQSTGNLEGNHESEDTHNTFLADTSTAR